MTGVENPRVITARVILSHTQQVSDDFNNGRMTAHHPDMQILELSTGNTRPALYYSKSHQTQRHLVPRSEEKHVATNQLTNTVDTSDVDVDVIISKCATASSVCLCFWVECMNRGRTDNKP